MLVGGEKQISKRKFRERDNLDNLDDLDLSSSGDNLNNLNLSFSKDNSNSSTSGDNSLLDKLLEEDSDLNNLDDLDNLNNLNKEDNKKDNKDGEAIKGKENSIVIKYKKLIELEKEKKVKDEKYAPGDIALAN